MESKNGKKYIMKLFCRFLKENDIFDCFWKNMRKQHSFNSISEYEDYALPYASFMNASDLVIYAFAWDKFPEKKWTIIHENWQIFLKENFDSNK